MPTTSKLKMIVGAGTSALALGIGVIAVTGSATGAPPSPPKVATLTSGGASDLPAPAADLLNSEAFAEDVPNINAARRVAAPGSKGNDWYLVPTSNGACFVTEAFTVTCAPTSNVNAGTLVSMTRAASSPSDNEGLAVGGAATIEGVAPDGIDSVRVVGPDGRDLAATSVTSNVYRLSVPSIGAAAALQLTGNNNVTTTAVSFGD